MLIWVGVDGFFFFFFSFFSSFSFHLQRNWKTPQPVVTSAQQPSKGKHGTWKPLRGNFTPFAIHVVSFPLSLFFFSSFSFFFSCSSTPFTYFSLPGQKEYRHQHLPPPAPSSKWEHMSQVGKRVAESLRVRAAANYGDVSCPGKKCLCFLNFLGNFSSELEGVAALRSVKRTAAELRKEKRGPRPRSPPLRKEPPPLPSPSLSMWSSSPSSSPSPSPSLFFDDIELIEEPEPTSEPKVPTREIYIPRVFKFYKLVSSPALSPAALFIASVSTQTHKQQHHSHHKRQPLKFFF